MKQVASIARHLLLVLCLVGHWAYIGSKEAYVKVTVVGGGHIGTALTCYIKHGHPEFEVRLYTRSPECFVREITCNDWEGSVSYQAAPDAISDDPSVAAKDADIVFIALPHFAVEKAFADIAPYVSEGCFVGVLPGSGGFEFFFDKYFQGRARLFGFQRVPFTAKLEKYGHEVNLKSWKPYSVVGTLHAVDLDAACAAIQACGLKTEKADNFLAVSLTPSNPVLHTSRTFEIFSPYPRDHEFADHAHFYVGWGDKASETLFAVDAELHRLFASIPQLDMSSVKPLGEHYESPTVAAMTEKINSIATFQTVMAPMKPSSKTPGMFVADTQSRLFTEDYPWGLAIIRAYCEIFGVEAPTIDKVLGWYADYMGLEYYVDGEFCGKDLANTGIPQTHGITTPEQVIALYSA